MSFIFEKGQYRCKRVIANYHSCNSKLIQNGPVWIVRSVKKIHVHSSPAERAPLVSTIWPSSSTFSGSSVSVVRIRRSSAMAAEAMSCNDVDSRKDWRRRWFKTSKFTALISSAKFQADCQHHQTTVQPMVRLQDVTKSWVKKLEDVWEEPKWVNKGYSCP